MLELFKAGGFPMFFVLGFGLAALVGAATFAWRGDVRRVDGVKAWTLATLFSIVGGTAADLGAVCATVPQHPEWKEAGQYTDVLLIGLGESMSPSILGFTLLSLAWMLVAVGQRRSRPTTG